MRILQNLSERLLSKTEAAAACARECWCKQCLFGGTYCNANGGGTNPCQVACCQESNCGIYCHTV
ncbi:hypothetical protein [Streptomyces sp. NPDC005231]|uniref:hypothetical protein n=1 Tax=Streptomyces sp. NPDC005231 TaxID=3157026 RepID=UPI00339EFC0C